MQGLVSSGSAYIIASGPGYVFGVSTVTLTPSGFVLVNNNTQLGGNIVTNSGDSPALALQAYQLDSSMNPIAPQAVAAGISVQVPIQNSNAAVGTISPTSPVAIDETATTNGVTVTFNADPSNTAPRP